MSGSCSQTPSLLTSPSPPAFPSLGCRLAPTLEQRPSGSFLPPMSHTSSSPTCLPKVHVVNLLPTLVLLKQLEVGQVERSLGHWRCALKVRDLCLFLFLTFWPRSQQFLSYLPHASYRICCLAPGTKQKDQLWTETSETCEPKPFFFFCTGACVCVRPRVWVHISVQVHSRGQPQVLVLRCLLFYFLVCCLHEIELLTPAFSCVLGD